MPEGDSILWAATRIRPVVVGRVPDLIETPHPRHAVDRWPSRLAGQRVEAVDTHGKHLFLRFEGGLVIHSHLRMTGSWEVLTTTQPPRPHGARAWLVIRCGAQEVIQYGGPVLELMTAGRMRFNQQLAALGPDVLADSFDYSEYLARLRGAASGAPIGDLLLDQSVLAGIGNIWKAEGCWEALVDPWRPVSALSDAEARAIVERVRPRMLRSGTQGQKYIEPRVYGRPGAPCPRCNTPVAARRMGDGNRITYWCPGCQQ